MSRPTEQRFVLLPGRETWRIARVREGDVDWHDLDAGPDVSLEDRAASVARTLSSLGHDGGALAICLASSQCLCAEFATDDLERTGRRQAMAYRMEEHLPVAAEEVVADFLDTRPGRAMGVCVWIEPLRPMLDALAKHDVQVRSLLCEALLAAGAAVTLDESIDAVVYRRGVEERGGDETVARTSRAAETGGDGAVGSWDVIEIAGRKPVQWWWFADDREEAIEHVRALAADRDEPLRVAVFGVDELEDEAGIAWRPMRASPDEAVAARAAKVLQDAAPAWIDLRRDALAAPHEWAAYRTPAIALAAALALLLLSVIGLGQYRATQYVQEADAFHARMIEAYRDVLPGESSLDPFTLKRRLEIEKRQLEGVGGVAASTAGPAEMRSPSALVQLDQLLSQLPGDIRFRILELSIDTDRIRVRGEAQSHADAERIVVSLRDSDAFEVSPPETRSLRQGGVSFSFQATQRNAEESRPATDRRVEGTTAAATERGGET